MAKTKISEFSTTAGNNTDINSINIAEGCAPSGINDAIRELMRQLKEFQTGGAGDSVNSGGDFSVATNKFTVASASGNTAVAGTLAVTGTTTLTGALVSNGNATLGDGSGDTVTVKGTPTLEVNPTLSGGTANGVLYLNGSKVATSGSALTFDGTNGGTTGIWSVGNLTSTSGGYIRTNRADNATYNEIKYATGDLFYFNQANGGAYQFNISGSEGMRLTSTGLGIGTSSPGYKLDVVGTLRATGNSLFGRTSRLSGGAASVEVTGTGISLINDNGGSNNNWSLIQNTATSGQSNILFTSGAGTLLLDHSGNLGLGVTPSAWGTAKAFQIGGSGFALSSNGAGSGDGSVTWNGYYNGTNWIYSYTGGVATRYRQNESGHAWFTAPSGTAGDAITFTQAMTLDASGNLGIGTTSPSSILHVSGSGSLEVARFATTTDNTPSIGIYSNGSIRAKLRASSAETALLTQGALPLLLGTNDTERARIDSSGNLLVGTTTNPGNRSLGFSANGSGNGIDIYQISNTSDWAINSSSGTICNFYSDNGSSLVLAGQILVNGNIATYSSISDYRLKNVIGEVTGAGDRIDALEPVEYEWKSNGTRTRGFLAHKFQEVYPQSVTGTKDAVDADGKPVYQAMQASTSEVIADLVAEIQSLRKRLADAGIA